MLTLGIETSCDETAIALLHNSREILADVVLSQAQVHERFGGVVPEIASRNHLQYVLPCLEEALHKAQKTLEEVELYAVTAGPGLQGALLVGVLFAKTLAGVYGRPCMGVNHLEGHLLAIALAEDAPQPPFLSLVVSGGHTHLFAVEALGRYRQLASTRDDAAGEAFDKTARLLGLPYPGGAQVDFLARKGNPQAFAFPRALKGKGIYDFSFSGLKTAVAHVIAKEGIPRGQRLYDLCASFQEAVADSLTKKCMEAARQEGFEAIALGGGVAANSRLRSLAKERAEAAQLRLYVPEPSLCTDNAAMIALAGHEAYMRGERGCMALDAKPTWHLSERA
ncbi:MAG: tRNA (adenosine(37)-N6)-threonylcarbamoyltransferase complex transferase subunit TsaD [Cystobacterineae bacterium]|nr:tRNA (adenosine(37)-N6)-threonylcarbamoyltransferase complex transferase subunit TsaD [Cystobacterineae bacterium]